jgi:hypothetical protein
MVEQHVVIDRGLRYASRFARQQADQAIKKEVVRALVELVLNSDDSYRRLESRGETPSGKIDIYVDRRPRRRESRIMVSDRAEGMDADRMDRGVGGYGEDMAGPNVRGFFGRGLKDAIIGMGRGSVRSSCGGREYVCRLETGSSGPRYRRYGDKPSQGGTSTAVTIVVDRPDVRMPQLDRLCRELQDNFSLRDVMANLRRRVRLHDVGRRYRKYPLSYANPVGQQLTQEEFEVPGFPGRVTLELYRSDVPLASPADEGAVAPGGLLIACRKGIVALSLLRYGHDSNAEHLFGRVHAPYLDELLSKQEPVLVATREVEGLDWNHPYNRALKAVLEEKLKPFVDDEANRRRATESQIQDRRLRATVASALAELNRIAQGELSGDIGGTEPLIPPGGFGFVPEYVQVLVGREAALYVRSVTPATVPCASHVAASSDSQDVVVKTPSVEIEQDSRHDGLGRAKIIVEGRRIGAEAIVSANCHGLEAQALVKVISKRLPPPPDGRGRRRRQGLLKEIRFDDREPRLRSRFEDGIVIIETRAPTVSPYIGPGGEGAYDTGQGQVMLAELVTEAFCRELARRRIQVGVVAHPVGGEADAREREYRRLHNRYAARIHALFVQDRYRRSRGPSNGRRGRPSSEEMMDRAASAL